MGIPPMEKPELNVVTGAFSFTGKYITRRLLALGKRVGTLTGHPGRPNPFGAEVSAFPLDFRNPSGLAESLQGAATLYNTYWVRFPYGETTFERAVENTRILIGAAREAGVRRIVHISIAHADEASPFPYYRGKGELERTVIDSGLSYAIIRPTLLFGDEGILVNNIAWMLRRFPLFAVPGAGDYRLQPVHVDDVAGLAVEAGQKDANLILDVAGPEVYTFDGLVRLIAEKLGSRARIVRLPPETFFSVARMIGRMVNDVVITRDELEGLMADLLVVEASPTGHTRLSDWLTENAGRVGSAYFSELERHYR